MNKNPLYVIAGLLVIAIIGGIVWFGFFRTSTVTKENPPVIQVPPQIIEQPVGQYTYINATPEMIEIESPKPGATVDKEFIVTGQARGNWYFEASFPIEVLDKNGKSLMTVVSQAKGEWMTMDFVPFETIIKIPASYTGSATVILRKDNPSGLPENDASVAFPITVR